jgi:Predicted membrane protein involved in D-alanine export
LIFDSLGITVLYIGAIFLLILQRYLLPVRKYKQVVLLLANILILSWLIPPFTIFVITILALLCYGVAVYAQKSRVNSQKRKRILQGLPVSIIIISIVFLIVLWVFMKYKGPQNILGAFHLNLFHSDTFPDASTLISTIGLSYLFFKLIHFLVDSYRGLLPDLKLVTFLNYLFFFPTYLSGPIDRYQNFHHWVNRQSTMNDGLFFKAAFFRIFEGVVKKFIFVPLFVGYAKDFGQVHISDLFWVNVAVSLFAYSFYLYFDFSGYSDLAIGVAMMLGFKVPENFNLPYLAGDIAEFWKRWHISLSSILKEYIFLPLVRWVSKHFTWAPRLAGTVFGYLTTFLICGLWHGNGLNFAIWGLWHGLGLSIHKLWGQTAWSRKLQQINSKTGRFALTAVSIGVTFCYVSFGWLFFNYSVDQIREIREIAKLKISAEPYYYYGNTYTWGIKLKYQPISSQGKIDLDIRAKGNDWVHYADNIAAGSGWFDIYGMKQKDLDAYDNLSPGQYELRVSYQEGRSDNKCSVTLPVTVPEYTRYATLTADDLQAQIFRISRQGWGIKLKYHPPTNDAKVDIDYRPLGSNLWMRYEEQRPGHYHYAHIIGGKTDQGIYQSLKPGVYCIRIRYTNSKKGYFSDWTEISVEVPTHLESDGDKKDEVG